MSVTQELFAISTTDLETLIDAPAELDELFDPYDQSVSQIKYRGICDLDRATEELHGLLTDFQGWEREETPTGIWVAIKKVFGTKAIVESPPDDFEFLTNTGDVELAEGKYVHHPGSIKKAWEALEPMDVDQFMATKFDFSRIQKLARYIHYVPIGSEVEARESFSELYGELRDFLGETAQRGDGVISWNLY